MDYRECPAPEPLRHLVKAGWTLAAEGRPSEWLPHVATPDGCVEIIRRTGGRSRWNGEQPACFVAGTITGPAELRLSGTSRFVGLRLWPWTWRAISGRSPAAIVDRWADLAEAAPGFRMPDALGDTFAAVARSAPAAPSPDFANALLSARSVSEASERTGLAPRSLQRWFDRHVGLPPRTWLRLVRFSGAFAELPAAAQLAGHAADHGFADQAHMAREFRSLAGSPAARVRQRARGPFIEQGETGGN